LCNSPQGKLAWKNILLFQRAVWSPGAVKVTTRDPVGLLFTGLPVNVVQVPIRFVEYSRFRDALGRVMKLTVMLVVSVPAL
jgi:hypothetical protein